MKTILVLILSLFFLGPISTYAETFTFENTLQEWGIWGTGIGGHDSHTGHSKKGSLWLSSDWGEVQTAHYSWSKLTPGTYKVTAYVRAQDVQPNLDGSSFWHFFDGGNGTESVFLSLDGSYEWRKIEYTLKVQRSNLSIWFRLRSPGQVWIDDLTIVPVKVSTGILIADPRPLKRVVESILKKPERFLSVTLLDFDQWNRPHPFDSVSNQKGKRMGKFSSRKYYNLDPGNFLAADWSGYDRIELDVFNGNDYFVDFYLTLADDKSNNYWSQLNHKTHLAPGWNHLNFSLTQFLGERGSHRFLRELNRSRLKKIFLIVDPNEKFKTSSDYYIDNFRLTRNPAPIPPKGVYAFDFTSHKDVEKSGFQKVTSQHLYSNEQGFGFVSPKFWRVEDSQWAANTLRYSIGLLGGHFKVKLPNGKYRMRIVIDRLGYWDPPFWKDRTIYLRNSPVFKESRPFGKDYLKDLLQFESVVPKLTDHPYDLYLKKIFRPLEFSFHVTNGELDLKFEGDPTGINLNTLVVWEVSADKEALSFLLANEKRSIQEFNWMTRPIIVQNDFDQTQDRLVTLVKPSLVLRPTDTHPQSSQSISMHGGYGESPYQLIQLRGKNQVNWKVSDLKDRNGKAIPRDALEFSEVVPQYVSPDLNHETYMVSGKYLKKVGKKGLKLEDGFSSYLCLAIKIKRGMNPGLYDGNIVFTSDGTTSVTVPLRLKVFPYELPAVDFPVGFFGPDPISLTYFDDPDLEKRRKKYRHEAIRILGDSGFTTFSGIPSIKLQMDGDTLSLDTSDADELMTAANRAGMSKVYFSYGGKFPQNLLDGSAVPDGINETQFFQKVSPLLNGYLNRPGMPVIVHTFSDEAQGYSDRVSEDISLAKKIKSYFPFIKLGGFGSMADTSTKELRSYFEYGFFSNVSKEQLIKLSPNSKWGSYNASPGNLDDPRYTFGPGLFYAKNKGLSHYLEWHASSNNNFPYYDLDGRESDVTMFMPTLSGELNLTLRFVMAVEGIATFRKLKILEEALKTQKGTEKSRSAALAWLNTLKSGKWSASDNILRPATGFDFPEFHQQLNKHLESLFAF